ncbi:MAG: Ig domain-containing protein, partial [Defluviitaleaceae bacterium]|nr:Ig domain-containing protein [Defluviitaleaceae bacterium]
MQNKKPRNFLSKVSLATFIAILMSLSLGIAALAAPAMPEPVPFRQADGTYVMIQAMGDEFFNWRESEEGYIVQFNHDTENWHYAVAMTRDGTALSGHWVVGQQVPVAQSRLGGHGRITSFDTNFLDIAEEVAQQNKDEFGWVDVIDEFISPMPAHLAAMIGEEVAAAPPHVPTWPNDIVTRPYQPMLLVMMEWNNVPFNPQRQPAGWNTAVQGPYQNQTGAWTYAHKFEGNVHEFWSARLFGTTEYFSGPDTTRNASVVNANYPQGLQGITLNNWMLEATDNNQFVRPDGMGLDGVWGGRGSVQYFTDEVHNAIMTYGYFHADRARLQEAGVFNAVNMHIEHGIVSVQLDASHPTYNINSGASQMPSITDSFNVVRNFINWDNIPRLGGEGTNRYDVLAQDLNLYFIYGGYEASLGGNAAKPSFWGHASVSPWRNNITRSPIDEHCTGMGVDYGQEGSRRLASVTFPTTGANAGVPTRGAYGSHGEQSHTGIAQGLGIWIHEAGHSVWGLPDKAVGGGAGTHELCIGFWCGMGRGTWGAFRYSDYNVRLGTGGTHFRATFAYQLGWITPMVVDANESWAGYIGHWSDENTIRHWDPAIHSVENGDVPMAVKVTNTLAMYNHFGLDGNHVSNHQQFFLLENFQHVGFDRSASVEVWNRGILIWHVDTGRGTASNNSHRRFNLEGVMVPNQGIAGNMIHSGWFADPFWLPGEVFGSCTIEYHAERGWCDPECSTRFIDGVHTPISNFHAPSSQPVPWGTHNGFAVFPANAAGHTQGTHPEHHPQIVPTDVNIRVVGPGGSGRTGAAPTRENPTHFDPWVVVQQIWVEFGAQAQTESDVTVTAIGSTDARGNINFGDRTFGYTLAQTPSARTFRVANNGDTATGPLTISLLSHGPGRGPGYAADIRAFTLDLTADSDPRISLTRENVHGTGNIPATIGATITNLEPGDYVYLTLRPLHGLDVAVHFNLDEDGRGGLATDQQGIGGFHAARIAPHVASVMVTGRGGIDASFDASFMVRPSGAPTFADLQPGFNNATGPNSVSFYTGENWPGARADDAVPFLEWNNTGMPATWVPIVGTWACGDHPVITMTLGTAPSTFTREFRLSQPVLREGCDGHCGEYVTFGDLPRGLAVHPDNHWFGGHLWGRPTLAGDFNVAFYLRHKSDHAHSAFGGEIRTFDIEVVPGYLFAPYFALQPDGYTMLWYRSRTAHNLHGANNAAGNAALASGAYRILVNGQPVYGFDDLEPGAGLPLAGRLFDIRELGLVGQPGEVFEINMIAIVGEAHADHWLNSPPNRTPLFITAPVFTTTYLPSGEVDLEYNAILKAAGAVTWALAPNSNPLPEGLALCEETGAITGVPMEYGTFEIIVRATGTVSADKAFTIVINEAHVAVLSFNIFNNGAGGSPSRPNADLAANGIIRMWTQL